ncbi:hypothetical protein [Corynebacterium halotolerans]|uniref:hypothetical protein n=1 Tax=Corynebacterium halotolerans TaxID=225326 RepID=UPI003CEA7D13
MTLGLDAMKDPARIPAVLDQLRSTWEAQPDLELATLFGMLANRGIGWGSGDEQLIEALTALRREHPAEVCGSARSAASGAGTTVTGRYLVETEGPEHRITIDPFRISVRRVPGRTRPGIWEYDRLRRCRAGEPLLITDAAGIDHRLGVVARITLLDDAPRADVNSLDGLHRREIGEAVFHLRFASGATALLDHGLELYEVGRRAIGQRSIRWERLGTATPGQPLCVETRGGGVPEELGLLEQIVVLES